MADMTALNRWELVQQGKLPCSEDDEICDLWLQHHQTDAGAAFQPTVSCTPEQFRGIKSSAATLYIRANALLSGIKEYLPSENTGVILLSQDGCTLKLYGKPSFLTWARSHHICAGTLWCEVNSPFNGISAGFLLQRPVHMDGWGNDSKELCDVSISFAPIIMNNSSEYGVGEYTVLGGIAILTPAAEYASYNLLSAVSLAREIMLSCWQFRTSSSLTEANINAGIITVDQTQNRNQILICNSYFFKALKLAPRGLQGKYLEDIIDPLPHNRDFWDMVKRAYPVQQKAVRLSVSGNISQYNITIEPYKEDFFGIKGLRIFFSSKKDISKFISREIGNNAHMTFSDIVGISPVFARAVERAKVVSKSNCNVLLTGESGVGKDVFAQAIHNASNRHNCAAIPKELISSELFGYEPGAFTGASRAGNIGKFELANGGTLFLDEIGDMPLDLQAVLLRAIEQKRFMRIGGTEEISVDVKIIAATNRDLLHRIRQRQFREDLYYRISTTVIRIPPLRERKSDILLLAEYFLSSVCRRFNMPDLRLAPAAAEYLSQLTWYGNVRELQNVIEGLVQLETGPELTRENIQEYLCDLRGEAYSNFESDSLPACAANTSHVENLNIRSCIPDSREQIEAALLRNHYNRGKAAAELGISRSTLYRRIREYGLK